MVGTNIGTMYAVKHKPSEKYLPIAQKGKSTRGASFVDPVEPNTPDAPIRLFPSEIGARNAVIAYCKGEHHPITHETYEGGLIPDVWETVDIKPVAWRKREDFEIVPINLIEGAAHAD